MFGAGWRGGRRGGWYEVDEAYPPFRRVSSLPVGRTGGPEEPTGDGVQLRNRCLLPTEPLVHLGLLQGRLGPHLPIK